MPQTTEHDPTQQDIGVGDLMYISATDWPPGAGETAWTPKTFDTRLFFESPWLIAADLDVLSIPWKILAPDGDNPLLYIPTDHATAEMILRDAGYFRPFSWFENGGA